MKLLMVTLLLAIHAAAFEVSNGVLVDGAGRPVRSVGFAVTCLQYLLRGIGTKCLAEYQWNDPSNLITKLDFKELDAIASKFEKISSEEVGVLRLSLTAAYYLDESSVNWESNRNKYPNLSMQYKKLIKSIVEYAASKSLLVVFDLHWSDDVVEQQPMASKRNSIEFWETIANDFAFAENVMYELYNEPYVGDYESWAHGNSQFEGMKPMYDAVRKHTNGVVLIAGASNYAYDSESILKFDSEFDVDNVGYVVHPYMGPYQRNDHSKTAKAFDALMEKLAGKFVFLTEFGQYCCPADGACFLYPGVWKNREMGFTEAVLNIARSRGASWAAWGWRPNGEADCNQPDVNDGDVLVDRALGAPWARLFDEFTGAAGDTAAPSPVGTDAPSALGTDAPSAVGTDAQAALWEQCGGKNHVGPTECEAGSTCFEQNEWYSQCVPGGGSQTTQAPQSPTQAPQSPTQQTTQPPTQQTTQAPTQQTTQAPTQQTTQAPTLQTTQQTCSFTWGECSSSSLRAQHSACCDTNDECVRVDAYYSQCRPKPSDGSCAENYADCSNSSCCGSTFECVEYEHYSQCRPR